MLGEIWRNAKRQRYLENIQKNTPNYGNESIRGEFLDLSQQLVTAALNNDPDTLANIIIADGLSTDHPETRHVMTIIALSMFVASVHRAWAERMGISEDDIPRVWASMMQDIERQKS